MSIGVSISANRKASSTLLYPRILRHVNASGDTVGATCRGAQALVWTIKGGLQELPTDHVIYHAPPEHTRRIFSTVPGVLFPPGQTDAIWLVWMALAEPYTETEGQHEADAFGELHYPMMDN